jgi:hypothetical protein
MTKTLNLSPFIQVVTLACCTILHLQSYGQNNIFLSATKEQEPIFRGAEYRLFPPTVGDIIYFKHDTITHGDVIYFDRHYKNIPLLYDQLTDELVTVNLDGSSLIRLYSPKVKSFRIYSTDFVFLPDSVTATTGNIWQVIPGTHMKVFKKEVKTIETKVVDHKMARVVRTQTKYRIFLDNKDYDISSKKALITALAKQQRAILSFVTKNRRHFRKKGFETMILETTNYYHLISAQK